MQKSFDKIQLAWNNTIKNTASLKFQKMLQCIKNILIHKNNLK